MRAAITTKSGGPEVIRIKEIPIPVTRDGWVLVKVFAAGINRSEMFTRQGHSPNVVFPRVQGIECVGEVVEDPSGRYAPGQQVAALMGEMGREFDGGYAEYALLPVGILHPFKSQLPWSTLGAIPEMYQTVGGSLYSALDIQKGDVLLIRGGTSSIGLMAAQLAKLKGLTVISTTRNTNRTDFLLERGVDHVIIDSGSVCDAARKLYPTGVNKVLELVGTTTLKDSLKCIGPRGVVCMTGILGNSWTMDDFTPMGDIPSTGRLTVYMGDSGDINADQLQEFINEVAVGTITLPLGPVLSIDEVPKAHQMMEDSAARGKIVVVM